MRALRGLNKLSWRCGPVLPFARWPWAGPPRGGGLLGGSLRLAIVVRTHVWGPWGVDFTWIGAALPDLGDRGRLVTLDWTPAQEAGLGRGHSWALKRRISARSALEWGRGGSGGEGGPSCENPEQNNRIKETGLKGSQSRWPWLQARPGRFLRPWEGGHGPLCGAGQAGPGPCMCLGEGGAGPWSLSAV